MFESGDMEERAVSAVSRAGRRAAQLVGAKLAAGAGLIAKKLAVLALGLAKTLVVVAGKAALAAVKALVATVGPVAVVVLVVVAVAVAVVTCFPGSGSPAPDGDDAATFALQELYEDVAFRVFPPEGLAYRDEHGLPWAAVWAVHVAASLEADEETALRVARMLAPRFELFESRVVRGYPDGSIWYETTERLVESVDAWDGRWQYRYRRERMPLVHQDGTWVERDVLVGRFFYPSTDRVVGALTELLGRPVSREYAELLVDAARAVAGGYFDDPRLEQFLQDVGGP